MNYHIDLSGYCTWALSVVEMPNFILIYNFRKATGNFTKVKDSHWQRSEESRKQWFKNPYLVSSLTFRITLFPVIQSACCSYDLFQNLNCLQFFCEPDFNNREFLIKFTCFHIFLFPHFLRLLLLSSHTINSVDSMTFLSCHAISLLIV